jgi:hypothetical protein
MSRQQRKKSEEDAAPLQQLEHVAFNTRGHAMEDGMKNRNGVEFICAYQQGGPYNKELQKRNEAEDDNEPFFRIDDAYTDRELADPEIGVKLYLVVGYTPRVPTADLKTMRPGQGKQSTPVGVKEPNDGNIIPWSKTEPPVLVVTEVLEQKPDGVQLWALIKPKNGLCTPFSISQDLVFYRHEFRDSISDLRTRCTSWNAKVAFHSVKPGMNTAPLTEKQKQFKRARDPVKLVFDSNVSLCNEIASLAANYFHTKDQWYLQEIKDVLRAVDADLNHRPLAENSGLRMFIEAEHDLTEEQCQLVAADFLTMWPHTPHMEGEYVRVLKSALMDTETHLPYRLLKPFLAEGCWLIGEAEVTVEDINDAVQKLVGTLQRTYGSFESTPPISANDQNALLATTLAKLKEIRQAAVDAEMRSKESYGEVVFDGTSHEIWATYGEAPDTDTARAAWSQELRLVVAAAHQKEAGLKGMVQDLITPLERLKLDGFGRN